MLFQPDRHRDRVAIVTGAGRGTGGVGRAIALRLAREGAKVLVTDLGEGAESVAEEIRGDTGQQILAYAGNLALPETAAAVAGAAVEAWGRIDILINNAGGGIIKPFLDHDPDSLRETVDRNLWTAVWCCHRVLPVMVERGYGRIVNIGADSTRTGIPGHAGYNAAKGGVEAMSVGLAREFAEHDITVNTVAPCVVNTARFADLRISNKPFADAFLGVIPKGRPVEIDEVASMASYLASAEAGFVTGQVISVNGGSAMP